MTKTKILAFGAHSLIGEDVCRELKQEFQLEAHSRKDLDLTNIDEVEQLLEQRDFDFILYAAGLTDPEACEEDKEKAFFLNADIPGKMARLIAEKKPGCTFIFFSDAMVFSGEKAGPYDEQDVPGPQSVYGRSKFQGEKEIKKATKNHIIIRTSWIFGKKMKGIFKKLLEIYKENQQLKVVSNFTGNPTYAVDIGRALQQIIKSNFRGTLHLAAQGCCSWYDYTYEFLNLAEALESERKLVAMKSDGSHLKSSRPGNSCLDSRLTQQLGIEMPYWKESLKTYVDEVFLKKKGDGS